MSLSDQQAMSTTPDGIDGAHVPLPPIPNDEAVIALQEADDSESVSSSSSEDRLVSIHEGSQARQDESLPIYGPMTWTEHVQEESRKRNAEYEALWQESQRQRAEKRKTYDIFVSKLVSQNLILKMLPREVRDIIWGHIFKYNALVKFCELYYEKSRTYKMFGKYHDSITYHRYVGIKLDEFGFHTATQPTFRQEEAIKRGESELPLSSKLGYATQVACGGVRRGSDKYPFHQIINEYEPDLEVKQHDGVTGPPRSNTRSRILRVNKQFHSEGAEMLYRHNKFQFELENNFKSHTRSYGGAQVHDEEELQHYPHLIPGMLDKEGRRQSSHQVKRLIKRLFDRDAFIPSFATKDPLIRFFRRIGVNNACWMENISISGRFKTVFRDHMGELEPSNGMGFARVLKIQRLVLKVACPNLKELTLEMRDMQRFDVGWRVDHEGLWDNDVAKLDTRPDEDKYGDVVQSLVAALPSLRKLNLDGYTLSRDYAYASDTVHAPNGDNSAEIDDDEDTVEEEQGSDNAEVADAVHDPLSQARDDADAEHDIGDRDEEPEAGAFPQEEAAVKYTVRINDPWGKAARWISTVQNRPAWKRVNNTFVEEYIPRTIANGKGGPRHKVKGDDDGIEHIKKMIEPTSEDVFGTQGEFVTFGGEGSSRAGGDWARKSY